ncbi:TPA: EAL domain-containing protein [Legionella pneumophila subsp. fraseri]
MTPYSGIASIYGQEIAIAANIACLEINKKGGILGKPLELIIKDDGSMPGQAVIAASSLVDNYHCQALIGNLLSNSRLAVAYKVCFPRKIIYLNFSFYEGSIFNQYFFNFSALPNQQITKMIPYLIENFGYKFYFAGSNYEWPRGSIAAAKEIILKMKGEIIAEDYFDFGMAKPFEIASAVVKSGANIFMPFFAGIDQIAMLKAIVDEGLRDKVTVAMSHYDETMMSSMPEHYRHGFYSCNSYFMSVKTSENEFFLNELLNSPGITGLWPKGNGRISNFGEGVYLCIKAYANAINQANSFAESDVLNSLSTVQLMAPQGFVKMDERTHHAYVNCYLSKSNNDGTFSIIKSFGLIEPQIPKRYQNLHISTKEERSPHTENHFAPDTSIQLNIFKEIESILTDIPTSIIITNSQGQIIYVNKITTDKFGYNENELMGQSLFFLFSPQEREYYKNNINSFLLSKDRFNIKLGHKEMVIGYTKDGCSIFLTGSVSKRKLDQDIYLFLSLNDITKSLEEKEKYLWSATHDPLTKLINKSLMIRRINSSIQRSKKQTQLLAILYIDFLHFQFISNIFGYQTRELLITEMANRILKQLRSGDTLARFGEDRFVILCEHIKSQDEILDLSDSIINTFKHFITIKKQKIFMALNIGICFKTNEISATNLLRNAEFALYESKQSGKNKKVLFNDAIYKQLKNELALTTELQLAVQNKALSFKIQPIVFDGKERIIGGELLIRWIYKGKSIPPDLFIPIAERSGVMHEIGYWILEQGCLIQSQWQRYTHSTQTPYVSINLSSKQLEDSLFCQSVKKILRRTSANPKCIILEITESTLMEYPQTKGVIKLLMEMGFQFAIDDFGTGYSSLKQLVSVPINILKIDKCFVDNIIVHNQSLLLLKYIIKMAHLFNSKVIIEGIELKKQLELLRIHKPDGYQGYLFYKPLSILEFNSKFFNLYK